jgi:L-seryl-tRNA(Ser) seleniumtransferase
MIAATTEDLRRRAEAVVEALPAALRGRVSVGPMLSTVGGGSLPGETLDSVGLVMVGGGSAALAGRLRAGEPPVIGRVQDGAVMLDFRTVDPDDDAALGRALALAIGGAARRG